MATLKPCIIFDIDGTVANLQHRVHLVSGRSKQWDEFDALMHLDLPIEQTIWLNQLMAKYGGMPIVCASGRADNMRSVTEAWLDKHGVVREDLFMRKHGDYRADHIIKKEILEEIRSLGYEPFLVIDDRQSVTDMWRSEGIFVLQCDPNPGETFHDIMNFHEKISHPLMIMVGPSGAGKSTSIRDADLEELVIRSDTVREMLTGSIEDQSQNQLVFETMHELASTRLKLNLPVILDATHLRNKDRIKAAQLVPSTIPVLYKVVNRDLNEKLKTRGWRSEELIRRHDQVFKSNLKDILKGDDLPNVTVDTSELK